MDLNIFELEILKENLENRVYVYREKIISLENLFCKEGLREISS